MVIRDADVVKHKKCYARRWTGDARDRLLAAMSAPHGSLEPETA
jgi:hypothetical protein